MFFAKGGKYICKKYRHMSACADMGRNFLIPVIFLLDQGLFYPTPQSVAYRNGSILFDKLLDIMNHGDTFRPFLFGYGSNVVYFSVKITLIQWLLE